MTVSKLNKSRIPLKIPNHFIFQLDKERRIELLVSGANATLELVDFNEMRVVSSPGKFEHLNVGFEALYIGGVPDSIKERISKQLMHVQNATSMRGCVKNVLINSELRDLNDLEYSHKVKPGCSSLKACRLSRCSGHGECRQVWTLKADFECACVQGWTGDQCQKPVVVASEKLQYRAIALSSN